MLSSNQHVMTKKKKANENNFWSSTQFVKAFFMFLVFSFIDVAVSLNSSFQPCQNSNIATKLNISSLEQCAMWSDEVIPEICSAGTPSRLRILKQVFLFAELQPLSLFEVFSVGMNETTWLNQQDKMNNDCILGSINRCTVCFKKISSTLRKLNEAFQSFDITLSRFDCLPAIDTASATRPFSPNATCVNCKIWYRRWLLIQSLQIWKRKPCINWCYYTQLACPHLAPAKLWDYAGHPSFQCRDMDIDSWSHECDCIHPCDVRGIVNSGVLGNAPSVQYDFFPAQIHCDTRKRECHQQWKIVKK